MIKYGGRKRLLPPFSDLGRSCPARYTSAPEFCFACDHLVGMLPLDMDCTTDKSSNCCRSVTGRQIAPWILLLLASAACGCVTRRVTILSNPPGALVYIDNQEVGVTPVSTKFTYYGTREIRLVRDDYETLTVAKTFYPPWYEYPGVDFVSENLWPREIHDERVVSFDLLPKQIVATDDLVRRAELLRTASATGLVTPLPPSLPGEVGPPRIEQLPFPAVTPHLPTGLPAVGDNSILTPPPVERPIRPPSPWEGY